MSCPSESALKAHLTSPFFQGLSPADFHTVVSAADSRQMLAKSIVVNQGASADCLFLLTKGRARHFFITQDGIRRIGLRWVLPGDIFGAVALSSTQDLYLVSTEMVRDGWVLVWDRKTISNLAGRYPKLWENAVAIAADYLAFYAATRIALTCSGAEERLAYVLTTLASSIGHHVPTGIALDLTNEELAEIANVAVFTVSRLLSEWQRKGAVIKSRGKILLRSPEQLLQSIA